MMLLPLAAVLSIATSALAYSKTYNLGYNPTYDDSDTLLSETTCANGEHGLLTYGYKTFGDIPSFPNIGAAPHIAKSSAYCGSCWELIYTGEYGTTKSVNITAIDRPREGWEDFTTSASAFWHLAGENSQETHVVKVDATRKPRKWCFPDEH